MPEGYDVVIVGGGHNGLTTAGYLAKAGQRVLVLEAREVVGGGCATKEVAAPAFRHNFHSNFHGIIHMGPVYRDLELERYGAEYVWPENQFGHVFPDGRALVCSRNLEMTVERIARFSARDAETFRELAHVYRGVLADGMIPAMFSAPGPPSGDLVPLEAMGTGGLGLIRQFLSAPNHVARDLFESPEVQTWVGFWVAQLAGTGDVFGLGRTTRSWSRARWSHGDGRYVRAARASSPKRWRRSCAITAARSGSTPRSRGSRSTRTAPAPSRSRAASRSRSTASWSRTSTPSTRSSISWAPTRSTTRFGTPASAGATT